MRSYPVDHGVLVRRNCGESVTVVRLTEHLHHRLGPGLLTRPAHRAGAGLGAQVVKVRPGRDGVLKSQCPRSVRHQLVLPQQRDAVYLLNV